MIILTGASGFVGQNLVAYFEIFGISQLAITRRELEDGDYSKIDNADSLVHLAGKAHDLNSASSAYDYLKVNFDLTKRVYDAFLQSTCNKFIFISSVKAVADYLDIVLTEEFVPNPQTHYGKSKLKAEEYIQSQTLPEGKSYYILRPCMIHGPGNKGNLNLLYQFVKKGIPYPLAAFENQRSFLSIENLCFVIKELLENDIPTGVYQIADDESLSTNDLVKEIAISLGLKPKLWAIPSNLISAMAKLGDKIKLPLNTERLNKLTENYIVSNHKIKTALGKELPIKAREGLRKTILSFNK